MSKKLSVLIIALLAFAAVEFGLLGADAAGITGGASHPLPPISQRGNIPVGTATATWTATPTSGVIPFALLDPQSIELTPSRVLIRCDGNDHMTLTTRAIGPDGKPVVNGIGVEFSVLGGFAVPTFTTINNGAASSDIALFGPPPARIPNVLVTIRELRVAILVDCFGGIPGCDQSPPSVSPPCVPTPYPCNPSPGSGPISPPCGSPTPLPCGALSPPTNVSPPCPPVSPPPCEPSPPNASVTVPCQSPTPHPCNPSPGSGQLSPSCATPTPPCEQLSPPVLFSPPCTPGGTPTPPLTLAIDCDVNAEGIQFDCGVALGATKLDAAIVLINNSSTATDLAAFNFDLHDADTTRLLPLPGVDLNFNGNPDFNEVAFPGPWRCDLPPPSPDLGTDGAGRAVSRLVCFESADLPPNVIIPAGGALTIATVQYRIPATATAGSIALTFGNVVTGDSLGNETGSCPLVITVAMDCAAATVRLGPLSPPAGGCADVNGDGRVTARDLALVLAHFGRNRYDPRYDVNHDGRINSVDAMIVRRQLGRVC